MAVFREVKDALITPLLLVLVAMAVLVVELDMVIKAEVTLIQCISLLVALMVAMVHQQTILIMLIRASRVQDKVQQLVCLVKLMVNCLLQVVPVVVMAGTQIL